jgi:3-methyladenine DNA glycosylase Tag
MVGKDTFIPSHDVVAALNAQKIVDRVPSSQRDQAAVQAAFNQWHAESGRPMSQLSMMLSYTANH